eukprot:15727780-Heterocapsa_arctica.AAC.1
MAAAQAQPCEEHDSLQSECVASSRAGPRVYHAREQGNPAATHLATNKQAPHRPGPGPRVK